MSALVDGLIAGFGIAIPLGAVSILIVNLALEKGFRPGFVAGAGTATVDMACALLAVFAGAAVVSLISPYATPLAILSGVVLIAMGVYGLMQIRRSLSRDEDGVKQDGDLSIYLKFIAITALNPFTVVYFLALIMGQGASWSFSLTDCLLFVIGVTAASLSWQTLLAGIGAFARQHLSPRFMQLSTIVGNGIVILLGIQVLLSA